MQIVAAAARQNKLTPEIPSLPEPGKRQRWSSVPGAARALALLEAVQRQPRLVLVITADSNVAQEILAELAFFNHAIKAGNAAVAITCLPDPETLPYDHFSPHPDIVSDRLHTLYRLQNDLALQQRGICVVSAAALAARLCPREHINTRSLVLRCGEKLDLEQLKLRLAGSGYLHRESVFEHGDFAVRGSIIDLFPMGSQQPYRIELFDDEIESLRSFDPETQRSQSRLEQLSVLPAAEVSLDPQAINLFRDHWHQEFHHDPDHCPIYTDTVAGVTSAGIEAYLPMFYPRTDTLFDYLPAQHSIALVGDVDAALAKFQQDATRRHEQQSIDPTRPLLPPQRLYLGIDETRTALAASSRFFLEPEAQALQHNPARGDHVLDFAINPPLSIDEHSDQPLQRLASFLANAAADRPRMLFCVTSPGRRELLLEKLHDAGIEASAFANWQAFLDGDGHGVAVAQFNLGARLRYANICVVAEPELFGGTVKPRARKNRDRSNLAEATIQSLVELRSGAAIVHIDHGVGRYLGLERMPVPIGDGKHIDAEFMALEYAGGDKLYVPVTSMHLIARYMGGDEDSAPLNKLGSESWQNAKRRAIDNVRDVAAELLAIYATRKSMPGYAHQLDHDAYRRFCEQFPFEETQDQASAIDAVVEDMCAPRAMDRLVCGDVGFGKTEVAMRAAFVAVNNSKQVMILVPTTLLAQQHLQNFQDRFGDWPIRVDALSRFRSASEQKRVLEQFAAGSIDILIGTHKLIHKPVATRDLGLVVVDEEHRFGVAQKEQLKRLCADVDLLTMTATPIPRTLNMAMAGLRDLSLITTPPARRLSVKTFVREKQTSLVQEAMLRELLRGGQVFYLHNDVSSIERVARELDELLPEARISIGHGQMAERALEQVMADFYHKKYNVLVCTTIIETGIDIPNANTIIIERADKFGLAQLHQLRGRVGRSHHQAYAYLFIPGRRSLTRDAEKRLQAIEEAQDLGAGFMLATHDLEIRGAGELLGSEQSGQIQSVGFSMYLDMLDRAVTSLKAGEEIDIDAPLQLQGEMKLHLAALIPDDYLPDIHTRLILYKRIANADSEAALRELKVEMIDRFGLLRPEINNLFELMRLKLAALPLGIQRIDAGVHGGYIEFGSKTPVDPLKIVNLVQQSPDIFQLRGATRLNFRVDLPESTARIAWVHNFLGELAT
ncbi:MAG: transcription-repair coupling factor [Pseudomonadales bacterium]